MTNRFLAALGRAAALTALAASAALAQSSVKVGTLTCDVSAGIGMLISQQQTMTCAFDPASGGPPDNYTGRIDKFGLTLGAVQQGTMVWGVLAPSTGFPHGALAGSYGGVGAEATAGAGLGANLLVGGTGPLIFSAASFHPGSDRSQFRRWSHDPDADLGALTGEDLRRKTEAGSASRVLRRNGRAPSALMMTMAGTRTGASPHD